MERKWGQGVFEGGGLIPQCALCKVEKTEDAAAIIKQYEDIHTKKKSIHSVSSRKSFQIGQRV